MKVLHLISGGDTGGAKTHIISLLKGINKIIDAKVVCFIEDTFYYDAKAEGINIEVFEQKKRYDLSVIDRLVEEIKTEDYDIIHCHGARANFNAMFLMGKVKKPFITTIHSDYKLDFKDNFYKRVVFTGLNTFALKKFDYYIAISDTFKSMLVDRGFKKDHIYTVYNGIDMEQKLEFVSKEKFLERYQIDAGDKTIVGIIARLDKVKDHETFIKGAEKVIMERDDVLFLIAGDGNEEERLIELVKEHKLENDIKFLGFVNDPYSFLNTIDINTLTSVSESFPYAILEGALMKKPIVSTSVGGLNKLVEQGKNGYLVPVGDFEEFAMRIDELASDKDSIRMMGESLYKKVEANYSSDNMAREHVDIYKSIIENGRNK